MAAAESSTAGSAEVPSASAAAGETPLPAPLPAAAPAPQQPKKKPTVLVVGAGVMGLSCGILLLEAGYAVQIWAKEFPPNTTSNKAAAVWYPFVSRPPERVSRWSRLSLQFSIDRLFPDAEAAGLLRRPTLELYRQPLPSGSQPFWQADSLGRLRRATDAERPPGFADGYSFDGFVLNTDRYMAYLLAWFQRLGGGLLRREVHSLHEAFGAGYHVVVNCSGLGARRLCGDRLVYPTRGQILVLRRHPAPQRADLPAIFDEEDMLRLAYVIPRQTDVVIGGTAQEYDWCERVREADTRDILARNAASLPDAFGTDIGGGGNAPVATGDLLAEKVGLRPSRTEIRLDHEFVHHATPRLLVHNYGHGGSGLTVNWGCAIDVCALIAQHADATRWADATQPPPPPVASGDYLASKL